MTTKKEIKEKKCQEEFRKCRHVWIWRSGGQSPEATYGWWNCKSSCKIRMLIFGNHFPTVGVIDCEDRETKKMFQFFAKARSLYFDGFR